jgi:hypothetical protein
MKLGRLKPLVAVFISLFSLVVISARANAAGPTQVLTVSPASVNTLLQPGSVNHGTFEIINQGRSNYSLDIYATPYHVSGEAYAPGFTYLPGAPKVASWFSFSTTNASVNSGQTKNVNYTITVPKNTPSGGYYAVAFAETKAPKAANAVTVNERAGIIFYIQIAGPVVQKGSLVKWHMGLLQKPPLVSSITLNNTGSIHYFSNIKLNVKDIFGGLKYSVMTQKALLPKTIRLVNIPWPGTPDLGIYKVSGTYTIFNKTGRLPTRYVLVMSNSIRAIFLILIVLFLIFLIIRILKRRKAKPKDK